MNATVSPQKRDDLSDENSLLLGVGDMVKGEVYTSWPGDTHWHLVHSHWEAFGKPIDQDDRAMYRILRTPIAKDVYATGAARSASEGRGRFDLVPYEAMLSLAKRYEMGAIHFGDRNWEKGQPLSRLLSSLRRHAHQIGYDYSEDHAGAVLWNAAAFVTMVERMRAGILPKSLDDIGYFANEEATKQ